MRMTKNIIQRIIVGVGIAICLFLLKSNVFALECGMSDFTYRTAFDNPGVINQTSSTTSQNSIAQINVLFASPYVQISFDDDYDYYIVSIPFNLSANFQSTYTGGQSNTELASMAFLIGTPDGNITGYTEGGLLKFKIKDSITIKALYLRVPNMYYNFGATGINANIWGYWTIEKYKCSDTTSAIEANTQAQNDTNDILNDDDTSSANSKGSEFFNNFSNTDHGGLSGIISSPMRLINSLASSTCNSLVIPLPFVNNDITLPCMSTIYSTHFPTFLTLYQLITTGLIAYWILIKLYGKVKALKNPEDDKVEVLEL